MNTMCDKLLTLRRRFRDCESAVVAFSGGVDSAVLAKVAREELGDRMVAVTACSSSIPQNDLKTSLAFCLKHDIPHVVVHTEEFKDERFTANPADRCYYCKRALYDALIEVAKKRSFKVVVEGTNASDLDGHRPGYRASQERKDVVTPLIDCGIVKEEVRVLAHKLGLGAIADKPATACLSSRIPTGVTLNPAVLERVDKAEDFLRSLGFSQVRVRHEGELARIEIGTDEFADMIEKRATIDEGLKQLGYRSVTLDLKGYRPATPKSST